MKNSEGDEIVCCLKGNLNKLLSPKRTSLLEIVGIPYCPWRVCIDSFILQKGRRDGSSWDMIQMHGVLGSHLHIAIAKATTSLFYGASSIYFLTSGGLRLTIGRGNGKRISLEKVEVD